MTATYTARFTRSEGWWTAQLVEMPGAITQGRTIEEARENLREAAQLLIDSYREQPEDGRGGEVVTEELTLTA